MTEQSDKVDFSSVRWGSVEWTNLCTLYLRAYESRLPRPVLGDRAAAEAVDRIDYDFGRMRWAMLPATNQFMVVLRAKQLDDWAADFLHRHPDAVVLHLGCGLDSRAFRLDPPPGVQWFDVDVPSVIDLRRKLYDDHDGYRMIASSVTDPKWLEQTPTRGPALVIAEGLLMYLTATEVSDLLQRLTDRFSTGELLADITQPSGPWLSKIFTSGIVKWGSRDGHELMDWSPRLKLLETSASIDPAKIPLKPQRLLYRLVSAIPAIRNYDRLYRFAF
ncbi:class I SAM-dependent methyltransferase [uncultured Mycobacterium sp.]|uniref:class I SAM-dependent methyltransferase n=1 Tax=uncultured Mycobacterium sp. TaxID=171292 RepID=UPI0035CBF53A